MNNLKSKEHGSTSYGCALGVNFYIYLKLNTENTIYIMYLITGTMNELNMK